MRKYSKGLAVFAPLMALANPVSAQADEAREAGEPARALALDVREGDGRVSLELVALSDRAQKVDYELELTGASRSRSSGSAQLKVGERHVLSRMNSNVSGAWCAVLNVTEADGQTYRVTAGTCE